jgi:hypothetical protein
MTKKEMEIILQQEVKGLSAYLDPVDYTNACNDASRETGWAFPTSTDFRSYWMKQRAKRHIFFYMVTESAHKFKYQQVNLQNRFEHYWKLIQSMDEAYLLAIQGMEDVEEAFRAFGTKVDAGFAYDEVGKDISYDPKQLVVFSPTESD